MSIDSSIAFFKAQNIKQLITIFVILTDLFKKPIKRLIMKINKTLSKLVLLLLTLVVVMPITASAISAKDKKELIRIQKDIVEINKKQAIVNKKAATEQAKITNDIGILRKRLDAPKKPSKKEIAKINIAIKALDKKSSILIEKTKQDVAKLDREKNKDLKKEKEIEDKYPKPKPVSPN